MAGVSDLTILNLPKPCKQSSFETDPLNGAIWLSDVQGLDDWVEMKSEKTLAHPKLEVDLTYSKYPSFVEYSKAGVHSRCLHFSQGLTSISFNK